MKLTFPTIIYRCPGDHHCAGGTYGYKGVDDADALNTLLADGWFLSLPEAINGDHDDIRYQDEEAVDTPDTDAPIAEPEPEPEPEPEDSAPVTRQELETKAVELAIKFDGRTTDKLLAEKIEYVLAEREGE